MAAWRGRFVAGAHMRGVGDGEAVFDDLAHHSGYAFCKAHALAWADMAMRAAGGLCVKELGSWS